MILLNWVIDGCEKPMVCLLPFKANTAKQSHGAGQGGRGGGEDGQAGRQTDGWPFPPPPNPNSQAATNQTQRRRRATTPTVLWLALMGLNLQQKVVAWLSIAFFCSLVLIEGGGEGDWRKMRTEGGGKKNYWGTRGVQINLQWKIWNKQNLICLRRKREGGKFLHIKTNTVMNRRQKKGKNK